MDYESQDGEVVTGMIGCGSQVVAFTTGRGHATGHPLVPVIKITGNYKTYAAMTCLLYTSFMPFYPFHSQSFSF